MYIDPDAPSPPLYIISHNRIRTTSIFDLGLLILYFLKELISTYVIWNEKI
jgi:hypothetical protein